MEESQRCISQQSATKTCADDPWLKERPELWCAYCTAEAELTSALGAWAVLGYI